MGKNGDERAWRITLYDNILLRIISRSFDDGGGGGDNNIKRHIIIIYNILYCDYDNAAGGGRAPVPALVYEIYLPVYCCTTHDDNDDDIIAYDECFIIITPPPPGLSQDQTIGDRRPWDPLFRSSDRHNNTTIY